MSNIIFDQQLWLPNAAPNNKEVKAGLLTMPNVRFMGQLGDWGGEQGKSLMAFENYAAARLYCSIRKCLKVQCVLRIVER